MGHRSGAGIGAHARILAATLLLGAAILSLAVRQVEAARSAHPPESAIRCAIEDDDAGYIDVYLLGESVKIGERFVGCSPPSPGMTADESAEFWGTQFPGDGEAGS